MPSSEHLRSDAAALLPPPLDLLKGAALFLDFDGTLVELAPRPDAVRVDGDLRALMTRLARVLDGRLAIVSGRSIDDVRALYGPIDFAISGSHGAELRWPDGRGSAPARPDWLDEATASMDALARVHSGVIVEAKPFGVGLHYRLAPDAEAQCEALARALAARPGVHLQRGKMMFEVRAGGCDKGSAVRALLADAAMAGGTPVFIGDDVTDEDAFVAVAALGGAGVLVGPFRPTAARYRLDDVATTRVWLGAAAEALA